MTAPADPLEPLPAEFFARPSLEVARDLVGALLVHEHPEGRLVGRIVETEGYRQDDPAFHGWRLYDPETGRVRPEGRAYDLFGEPGTAYVYLIYGRYWLLNVVTEPEGVGGAVLLRAVEPLEGIALMRRLRPHARRDVDLTSGPGKLTQAFGIEPTHHKTRLTGGALYFARYDGPAPEVATSPRIGITRGAELPWRFYVRGNDYVSK